MTSWLRRYAAALLSGALLACCFPVFHLYFLAWVALIPLLYRATKQTPLGAGTQFFVAGWVFHSVLLQWLCANIFWGGGWALIGYQLLCIGLALFWGMLGVTWTWAHQRAPKTAGALLFASLWVFMEWLHANLFTGFGWSALGYSQGPDLLLVQWAAVGGVSAVSFLMILFNGLVVLALRERAWRLQRAGAAALILLGSHGVGWLLLDKADYQSAPFTAGIFQSNFPQEMKWDWEYADEMVRMAAHQSERLTAFEEVDCFFWPEALVMGDYKQPIHFERLTGLTKETGKPLFTGTVRDDREQRKSYNSSVLIGADGEEEGYYDKVHLAPFGEYIPLDQYLPFLRQIVPVDVDAGKQQRVLEAAGRRFGPMICFEVLFAPMAEELRNMGADILVVVTNLGWFGMSSAIPQELELARLRAIETRLPLVHTANTGISAVVDPWGRIQVVNAALGYRDRYVKWEEESVAPRSVIMRRRLGALPVAAPGKRPIPYGPVAFPFVTMALAGLLLVAVLVYPKREDLPPEVIVDDVEPMEDIGEEDE